MLKDDVLRDLASKPYDAALRQTSWEAVLSTFAAAFSATKITLLSQELNERHATVLAAVGFDVNMLRAYEEYYRTRNVFMLRGKHLFIPGLVRTSEMTVPQDVVLKSEYYNDFMRPNEARYLLGTTVARAGQDAVHLSFFRPEEAGAYGEQEMLALKQLAPHVQRALQVHERIAGAEQHAAAMTDAIERGGKGVAFLDGGGRPLFVNAALETIFKAGDGLVITKDGLSAAAPDCNRALHALIANAAQGGSGGTLAVPRLSGSPPYSVIVSFVPKRAPMLARTQAAVLVVVSDPASSVHVDVKLLQNAYGLTSAEARIASRLANGATIDAVASQLRITLSTARTHLKRILHKTGAGRQSELVRLLLLTR